ncbi:MAG: L-threonylcarbamoyladenylate synthase [Bacteroidales bacterium]|nr:L-threonylcarbamoyladenylate synthase [Bacteroidales bacterium]
MGKTDYEEDLRQAVETLRKGGLILYPTDTVWGIGCDATNAEAVAKVFALKQRAEAKSMLVLVDSATRAQRYVKDIPDVAYDMFEMADKPLTLILDNARGLADGLVAEDGSVGIRVTNEKFSHDLCYRFMKAVVSTSANISGHPAAAIYPEIEQEIIDGVDYVVRYRRDDTKKSKPSSIVKLKANGEVTVIRP